jgi:hypothetical protein
VVDIYEANISMIGWRINLSENPKNNLSVATFFFSLITADG